MENTAHNTDFVFQHILQITMLICSVRESQNQKTTTEANKQQK